MQVITNTQELNEVCARFKAFPFVTVDTEFLRESTFWPELCLIQMASPDEAVIIDSQSEDLDLSAFFELMRDEAVVKVFHAARQDVEIIVNLDKCVPTPLFDTQVAAMVCGYGDSVGYDSLVKRITGEQIDKSSRFTDWSRRPLSDKQLHYALADVTHLRDVYLELKDQLEKENRAHWVAEEMQILTAMETYDLPVEQAWTRMRMRVRKPIEFAVLQKLAEWREITARENNKPRGRILKDDALFELAQQQPTALAQLDRLRAVPKGFSKSRFAEGLIDAIKLGLETPSDKLPSVPKPKRPAEGQAAAVELLKVLLKLTCEELSVAPKILANVDDLEKIAAHGEEAEVAALKGWRRELFGERALSLRAGKIALGFDGKSAQVIELD